MKPCRSTASDAFGRHVGLVGFVFAFENIDLFRFERRSGVAFDAADALAGRDVACEALAQQVGAYDEIAEELHRMTRIAYKACRCSGVVRVDFIVTPEGKPYMIEINSIPDLA